MDINPILNLYYIFLDSIIIIKLNLLLNNQSLLEWINIDLSIETDLSLLIFNSILFWNKSTDNF